MAFSECHVRRLTYWDFVPNPSGDSVPCTPGGDAPAGVLLSAAKIYKLPSERKSCPNTLQFKSFWGCRDLFSKRSRVVPRKHGVTGKPLCQKGFPRYHLLPSSPFPRFPASFSPRRQKQTDFSTVLLPFSHRPRCIISAKDRALPSPREKKKGRTRK